MSKYICEGCTALTDSACVVRAGSLFLCPPCGASVVRGCAALGLAVPVAMVFPVETPDPNQLVITSVIGAGVEPEGDDWPPSPPPRSGAGGGCRPRTPADSKPPASPGAEPPAKRRVA